MIASNIGQPVVKRGELADVAVVRHQPPLPETADELCAVAQLNGAPPRAVYLGDRVRERTIKALSEDETLATYRIVHFATHGLLASETESLARGQLEPALCSRLRKRPRSRTMAFSPHPRSPS